MEECFLGVGTPYKAPVDVLFAIAKMSDTEDPYTPMCMSGWQNGAIADLEMGDPINGFPNGFAAVWLSLTERKVYEIDVDFSDAMKDHVVKTMQKGFKNRRGKTVSYTHFKVSLFPNGMVKLHLLSNGKILSLDYVIQGTETLNYNNAFLEQFGKDSKVSSVNDYCDIYYRTEEPEDKPEELENKEDTPEDSEKTEVCLHQMADFVNQEALPNKLWERYFTRYDYSIRFDFESPDSFLYFWSPKFSNAESFSCQCGVNDKVFIKHPAAICSLNFKWRDEFHRYNAFFYFNEDEILPIFENAFASHPYQSGELIIKVSKYNNFFKFDLRIGEDLYPLYKTEIRVFREFYDELSEDSKLIYKNYEGNHNNHFNGL